MWFKALTAMAIFSPNVGFPPPGSAQASQSTIDAAVSHKREQGETSNDGRPFFQLPSGYVKIAIENDHRNSGFSHEKWVDFP